MSGPGEGYRDDSTKPRIDLLPHDAVMRVARVLTWACTTRKPNPYPERNWELGMNWSRVFNSAIRHAFAMWLGQDLDPDSGLPHVDHFATNTMILCAYFARPHLKKFDDRPQLVPLAPAMADPLKDCTSCAGTKGYHRTPCAIFEVTKREAAR
jgi:hypothetical protein